MDFGSGGNTDAKAWKNIWGCGQGIGAVKSLGTTADYVAKLTSNISKPSTDQCLMTDRNKIPRSADDDYSLLR